MTPDEETRLRKIETEFVELRAQVAPVLGVHKLLVELSIKVTELRGELATLRGQAIALGAVATVIAPAVFALCMKVLRIT